MSNASGRAVLVVALLALTTAPACFLAPQSPTQRLAEAARELNTAARFGRMDVAASLTAQSARKAFLARHESWGRGVRVLDVDLASLDVEANKKKATLEVDVAWVRDDDQQLRATRLKQRWSDVDGWQLVEETRVGGEKGLFGEKVTAPVAAPSGPPRRRATTSLGVLEGG